MSKIKKDTVIGLVLIAFGVFILYFSLGIKMIKAASFGVGSAFFPRICGVLLILLGAMLSAASVIKARKASETGTSEAQCDKISAASLVRMAVTLVTLILFVLLLHTLGFVICSILMQFTLMVTLAPAHKRSRKHIISYMLISFCTALVVYLVFVKGFNLMLPAGLLKGVLS